MIFADKLSMKQKVEKICQSTYLELRAFTSVRHVLKAVIFQVLSHLGYSKPVLSAILQQLIDKFQNVQNCSARLIFKTSKRTHASPFLAKLL